MPSLTCLPSASLLPVPAGAMGGCFSKPKPGDCHPAVSVGRSRSAQRTLAGGMLILGSCGEDYGPINPPQIPRCSHSQAESCAGAAVVLGGRRRTEPSPCNPIQTPAASSSPSHLLVPPPASPLLPSCSTGGQNCPPRAPRWVCVTAVPVPTCVALAPSLLPRLCHSLASP